MGLVSQEKINQVLDTHSKRKRIGEILLDLQIITPSNWRPRFRTKGISKEGNPETPGDGGHGVGYTDYDSYLRALSGISICLSSPWRLFILTLPCRKPWREVCHEEQDRGAGELPGANQAGSGRADPL